MEVQGSSLQVLLNDMAILLAVEENDYDLYKKVIIDLGVFLEEDSDDLLKRHFELVKETYTPYTKRASIH